MKPIEKPGNTTFITLVLLPSVLDSNGLENIARILLSLGLAFIKAWEQQHKFVMRK